MTFPKVFARSEAGSVSIEAALWLPFWILFMFGIGQTAFIFHGQARTLDVAQQANRAYAIGSLKSNSEVETYVKQSLASMSSRVTVNTSTANGVITTVVTVPALDFGIGVFKNLDTFNLIVSSQQVKET